MGLPPQDLPQITPATPGLLTRGELGRWLRVGKNEITGIAWRFRVQPLEGHYPERTVWRQILGLEPTGPGGEDLLRVQLQDMRWLAGRIGCSPSTIRGRLQAGTFTYPAGVQLGAAAPGRMPRLRRWLPAQIEAARQGRTLAGLRPAARLPPTAMPGDASAAGGDPGPQVAAAPDAGSPLHAVFAAIAAGSSASSR